MTDPWLWAIIVGCLAGVFSLSFGFIYLALCRFIKDVSYDG